MSRGGASSCSRRRWRRAWDDGRPDPYRAFENVGRAYLHFARNEPAYYSAMFEAGLPLDADPELREAADRAFEVLRRAAETLCARLPPDKRPPALMMSLHIWALSHGIASLFARGDAGRRACRCRPRTCWKPACWSICAASGSSPSRRPADPQSNRRASHALTAVRPAHMLML